MGILTDEMAGSSTRQAKVILIFMSVEIAGLLITTNEREILQGSPFMVNFLIITKRKHR